MSDRITAKCCAFTGHREVKDDLDLVLLEDIIKSVIDLGVDSFFCGMARGFDLIAGELVIKLRKTYPNIKLIACIPCPNQEKFFNDVEKKKYQRVYALCDERIELSDRYYKGCMFVRNRYMVDNSDYLIAYLSDDDTSGGGTSFTVRYASKCGKKILVV